MTEGLGAMARKTRRGAAKITDSDEAPEPDEVELKTVRRRGRPQRFTDEQLIEALEKSGGIANRAAELLTAASGGKLEITASGVRARIKRSEKLSKIVEEITETNLDIAEDMLRTNILGGDNTSIIFFLKTKGKHRGYVQSQKIEADVNVTNPLASEVSRKRPDEVRKETAALIARLGYDKGADERPAQ